jgi:hypothetical protein
MRRTGIIIGEYPLVGCPQCGSLHADRRTDGALIRLITPAGNDVKAAQQRLASFAQLVIPLLPQFIPD